MRCWIKVGLVLLGCMLMNAPAMAKVIDGIVAVVNDDIILYSELQQKLHILLKANPQLSSANPQQLDELRNKLLGRMIRERLAEQEIKRLKITVSPSEVDEAIENIKQENGITHKQFEVMLKKQGQTLEDFKAEVRREIERSRLIERVFKSKIVITDEQIDAYLQQQQGGVKERRRLAVIFLPYPTNRDEKGVRALAKLASEIDRRVKNGADFGKLARKYSKGPAADSGGDIGYISASELAPPLEAATRGLKPGECTDVLQTPVGFYILKLIDVKREGFNRGDPLARERVRRELFKREINRRFDEWMRDLINRSYIQVNLDNFPINENEGKPK